VKKLAVFILLVLCAIPLSVIPGCGGDDAVQATNEPPCNCILDVKSNGDTTVVSLDGVVLSEERISELASVSAGSRDAIAFVVDATSPAKEGETNTEAQFRTSNYFCKIYWNKHYVGSCIKRDTWHLNLLISDTRTGREVFNSHLCGWWQNGPQFGIYNSANGFCKTTRGGFTAIKNAIQEAIQRSVPWMPYAAAASIAYVSTVIVVPALAL